MAKRSVVISLASCVILFAAVPVLGAGGPCSPAGSPPQCDGECPPGEECVQDTLGNPANCICESSIATCGDGQFPAPQCWGECPPATPICADVGGSCACVVPTLSQWGLMTMCLLMLGSVVYLRKRHT